MEALYTTPVNDMQEDKDMEYVNSLVAATETGIDDTTIRKWAQAGKIPGAQFVGEGRRGIWRIPKDQVELLPKLLTTNRGGRPKGSKNKPHKTGGKSKP